MSIFIMLHLCNYIYLPCTYLLLAVLKGKTANGNRISTLQLKGRRAQLHSCILTNSQGAAEAADSSFPPYPGAECISCAPTTARPGGTVFHKCIFTGNSKNLSLLSVIYNYMLINVLHICKRRLA